MPLKDTEKIAVGALRQALQAWLAPQLSGMSERLAHIEGRLDGLEKRMQDGFGAVNARLDDSFAAVNARLDDSFAAVNARLDDSFGAVNARLDDLRDSLKIHERLARLEAERGLKSETSS